MSDPGGVTGLKWRELAGAARTGLEHKLAGLYGHPTDESAFDALAVDKQQALLVFMRRLTRLGVWPSVRHVENVYGTGGVGMDFAAAPLLSSLLLGGGGRFATRFGARGGAFRGFRERRRPVAALHFLQRDHGGRKWSVHFDLYGPLASPRSAWRHFFYEFLLGATPEWRAIEESLAEPGFIHHKEVPYF